MVPYRIQASYDNEAKPRLDLTPPKANGEGAQGHPKALAFRRLHNLSRAGRILDPPDVVLDHNQSAQLFFGTLEFRRG
jgi:hypothetical protein